MANLGEVFRNVGVYHLSFIHLFLVVKVKAPTHALSRSVAEDERVHSPRQVIPASTAQTKRNTTVITVAYLIDLYNHEIVFLKWETDGNEINGKKMEKNGNHLFPSELLEPLPVQKRLSNVRSLRNHFWCKFDYHRPELEDKEEIDVNQTLHFAEPTTATTTASNGTTPVIAAPTQDAVTKEANSGRTRWKDPYLNAGDSLHNERSRYLKPRKVIQEASDRRDISQVAKIRKIEISNLTDSIRNLEESWKKEKVKLSSKISKARNKSVALSSVLQNNNEASPSRLFLEILEKKERIKKMMEEKNGKSSTNKKSGRWPPLNSGKQPKIIRKDDLELVYIKGIQRQPIWVVKKCLSNLGIRHFYIRNVSFIGKDICELIVLKRSKPMIINILKVFENSFKVLENFNPVAVDNASTANDEDILKVEKDFFSNVIQNIKFTKFNIPTPTPTVVPDVEASTSGNNFAAPSSVCAPDNAPANSPGSTPEVANAARRSSKEAISAFALALKKRVDSPSKGFAAFKAANSGCPLKSPEFKGTSELFEDGEQNTEDDNDSIISSTLTPTVPNEHYQEVGMNMYSDTIIINSPNILNTTINPINPMDYSSEDIIESMKYIKE
ncbi:hypothetical protein H8356DRAFT_1351043 [Neocallimastix lanati (nom. inval.)]|nr:hypothetical protein H8356DRAFT_1351043 [Neocallimastix sp. JGI-2020a]